MDTGDTEMKELRSGFQGAARQTNPGPSFGNSLQGENGDCSHEVESRVRSIDE